MNELQRVERSPLRAESQPSPGAEREPEREREEGKVRQMDFFAGVRPLLFSYVLINGILITLQTKEGECVFEMIPISCLSVLCKFIGEKHACHAGTYFKKC